MSLILSGEDVRDGLTAVVSSKKVKLEPQFEAKQKLNLAIVK